MSNSAFGQSPAAGGDVLGGLANAAIGIGTAFATAQVAKSAGKSAGNAVKSNSSTILIVAGIGAVVVLGGLALLVVAFKK